MAQFHKIWPCNVISLEAVRFSLAVVKMSLKRSKQIKVQKLAQHFTLVYFKCC